MWRDQRGAALLAVLLLVAVIAALAAMMLERMRLATQLAVNVAAFDTARALADGAETLAVARIGQLADAPAEAAAQANQLLGQPTSVPLGDGSVATARVWDGGNCFNLNSVASGQDPQDLRVNPIGVAQFTALMEILGVDGREAQAIAASLADWIDADQVPSPGGGAEDNIYQRMDPPYRTADTLLAEVSELRAINAVTPAHYALLRPFVCALPTTELSAINVNTLNEAEAPLLAMLATNLSRDQAQRLIAGRPAEGWGSVEAFQRSPAGQALDAQGTQIGLRSRWFRLDLELDRGDVTWRRTALIDARTSPAKVVARQLGEVD
ncbi:MAG: type II secretion system minor pseudopilin GspK [Parasphingopyxis sp.]